MSQVPAAQERRLGGGGTSTTRPIGRLGPPYGANAERRSSLALTRWVLRALDLLPPTRTTWASPGGLRLTRRDSGTVSARQVYRSGERDAATPGYRRIYNCQRTWAERARRTRDVDQGGLDANVLLDQERGKPCGLPRQRQLLGGQEDGA